MHKSFNIIQKNRKPELLIPLNDLRSIYKEGNVLVNGDAFYCGVKKRFSMRDRAGNFSLEELKELIKKIHDYGKKLYLCTNIIIYNEEIQDLERIIEFAKEIEIDAIICHDFAAIELCKENQIPFHISTQANISNYKSALFFQNLGAERIILARELSLEQIKNLIKKIEVPVECFVHGAMCSAISGRCYLSAEVMGFDQNFSANRGKCVQPCRRNYIFLGEENEQIIYNIINDDFDEFNQNISKLKPRTALDINSKARKSKIQGLFFNAKDLCMIEHIDKLIEVGIAAFKIEGRMRDPRYISETAACYRVAIDAYFRGEYTFDKIKEWKKRLSRVFNRGFHTGFYFQTPTLGDIQFNNRGNVSKIKRTLIGKVKNYYPKSQAIEVKIQSNYIKIGDTLIFENDSGFYFEQEVSSLQLNNEPITKTKIASAKNHIIVGIAVKKKIPRNCKVFVLRD
ncbi:MAG: peptidase U32 family protein [Promethearchaeota archaeon]